MGREETPLYVRLKQALRNDINSQLAPGDLVPSEAELVARYGVSRTTVRLALGALANEGLVVKRQGRGTFVANPKQTALDIGGLLGMPADARDAASLISSEETMPEERIASLLQLPARATVQRIRWLQQLDGETLCYRVSYLPQHLSSRLPEPLASLDDVHQVLSQQALAPNVDRESVEVVLADQFRASLLHVSPGAPLLLVESLISDAGEPAEVARGFYSGHSVRLRLRAPQYALTD